MKLRIAMIALITCFAGCATEGTNPTDTSQSDNVSFDSGPVPDSTTPPTPNDTVSTPDGVSVDSATTPDSTTPPDTVTTTDIVEPGCVADTDCQTSNPCAIAKCIESQCEELPAPSGTPCGESGTCEGFQCNTPAVCGDGIISGGEACDDSNQEDGDYCSADCSTITGSCGDGLVQANEGCDGETYCAEDCSGITGFCGDGEVQSVEDCDDTNADAFDGCSPICTNEDYQAGDVIITEIMINPAVIPDADGEWFELYNTTGSDICLNDWTVGESGGAAPYIIQPTELVIIPAGGYLLFTKDCDPATNGGLTPGFCYKTAAAGSLEFVLNNDVDALTVTANGTTIDTVSYDKDAGWPIITGISFQLSTDAFDFSSNDDASNWCMSITKYWESGATENYGTPGYANETCP